MSMKKTSVGIPMSLYIIQAYTFRHAVQDHTRNFLVLPRTVHKLMMPMFPGNSSHTQIRSPRLESQQVLRHEIEAIAAVEGEPCPQRVVALCPEPRIIEQSHDVVRLERRPVKSPTLRVEDVSVLVDHPLRRRGLT